MPSIMSYDNNSKMSENYNNYYVNSSANLNENSSGGAAVSIDKPPSILDNYIFKIQPLEKLR